MAPEPHPEPHPEPEPHSDDRRLKQDQAGNFDALNEVLAGTPFDRHLRFFNFGYQTLDQDSAPAGPTLGRNFPNKESAQLLFEVVGDTVLTGARVIEVGCGRGGNLWLVDRYYGAREVVGIDIAATSVRFARGSVTGSEPASPSGTAAFVQGDAERLPLADDCADAVLSVETSCTYPDLGAFFLEVARIMAPGGWFGYTDLVDRRLFPAVKAALDTAGFDLVTERDITANVRASRDARASRQQLAFGPTDGANTGVFDEFVAAGGSTLHRYLTGDERIYHLLRLRRRAGAVPPGPLFDASQQELIRACAQETVDLLALR